MSDANPEIAVYRDGKSLTRGVGALPTPAQRCLVRAATCPIDEIEDALREWRSLVDLSGPIDGGSFRLIPTVFHRLQAAGLDDPNRGMFKGVYRRSLVENSRVLDAASPALRALHDVGITPWLVKGAGLVLAGYYPTLAARPMSDVDVVVDSTRRVDAVEVLRSLGYTTLVAERELVDLHAAEFVDASGMGIDAHWHHLHHARSAAADEVITRTFQTIALDGIPVKVPGPTGLLIATVVHGSTSDPEPPVRWL
ncbi:MAG: nucleotidyltransferase family protein, partial [Rhodoglobus sp.]|nr:nucleotidyltransferase family protein [Rhodoglobus sp.]